MSSDFPHLSDSVRPPMRIGIVGAGRAGGRRMRGVDRYPGADLAFVAESDISVRARLEAQLSPHCKVFADGAQAIAECPVDLLVISTPPAIHEELGLLALAAGIRRLLIEKPVTVTASAASRLLKEGDRRGAVVRVGSNLRFFREVRALISIVDSGLLGAVVSADFYIGHNGSSLSNWSRRSTMAGGGTLLDNGVHVIDLALRLGLLSSRLNTQAHLDWGDSGIEEEAVWRIECSSTVLNFRSSWRRADGGYLDLVLVGEKGTARLHVGNHSSLSVERSGETEYPTLPPHEDSWDLDTFDYLDSAPPGIPSGASLSDAALVISVVEQVYHCAKEKELKDGWLYPIA